MSRSFLIYGLPVLKLDAENARRHFMIGYKAKVTINAKRDILLAIRMVRTK